MTPTELRACLDALGWDAIELSKRIGSSRSLVYQWLGGGSKIHPDVATWLRARADAMTNNPPPPVTFRSGRKPWKGSPLGVGAVRRVLEAYHTIKPPHLIKAQMIEIADDGTRRIMFGLNNPKLPNVHKAAKGYDAEIIWITPK